MDALARARSGGLRALRLGSIANFREAKDFEEFISDLAETNLKD